MSNSAYLYSANIRGKVTDSRLNEELVGATIYIKELQTGTTSGLDGSYILKNISAGNYTIVCRFLSYHTIEKSISIKANEVVVIDFAMKQEETELEGINVIAYRDKSTEASARNSERNSSQVINVISARAIELSPDITVANVLQRMSGVTLDKSTAGSGQYALLRGMDKRYSYTLVNGIKIPSTHNKHRYISLDMFPSDLVDRIEVIKALTPDMEGDATAGAVNMIMKNAPEELLIQASASLGYSQFFARNSFITFNSRVLNSKSPYERNGSGYRAVPSDFPTENLKMESTAFPLNYTANLTIGNRFFNKRAGWIMAGSLQNVYTGHHSLYFKDDLSRDGKNLPILISMQDRIYNSLKRNSGIHNKLDYEFNNNNRVQLYIAYLTTNETQVRENQNTNLSVSYDPESGNISRTHSTRFRYNKQSLFNITLQGEHNLNEKLTAQWSAVYSKAQNQTPEEAMIEYANGVQNFTPVKQYVDFDGSTRIWRHNSDADEAAYLKLIYTPKISGVTTKISLGGLYRKKERTSFYNKYTLNAIVNVNTPDTSYTSFYSEKDVDWNTYNEILWRVYNPRGTIAVGENYDAYENVLAGYAMLQFSIARLHITGGTRIENTDQGYYMLYPIGEPEPNGNQKYSDILPSIHFKYAHRKNQNIRLSYYKSINKPGFQEIVPYVDASEEPISAGNKNLRHAIAHNIDLRWEYFPAQLDQIMAGFFYKNIKDPIEFAFDKFLNVSQNIIYTPVNSDKAINYGIEVDLVKYYRQLGLKGNYTYTSSSITSQKLARVKDNSGNDSTAYVSQTRPLFGQSAHVGNISLLYKGVSNGLSAQLALSYTGDRIYTVSRYIDNDLWQKGFWQLDASAEKRLKNGLSIYIKAHNILNAHVKVYIKKTNPINSDVPYHDDSDTSTLVRDEYSSPSYLIGARFKF